MIFKLNVNKFLLIFFLIPSIDHAQEINQSKKSAPLSTILKIGYSYTTLFGSEVDLRTSNGSKLENRSSFTLGTDFEFRITNFLFIKPGVNIVNCGGKLTGGGWVYVDPVKLTILRIPLVLGLSTTNVQGIKFSIEVGAAYNFMLYSEIPYSNDLDPSGGMIALTKSPGSILLGCNLSFPLNNKLRIQISYSFYKDINYFHIRKYTDPDILYKYELWNKGSLFTIGIVIPYK
ncbi:MAG: hypothetical protein KDC79_05030 [Cyclobacteriaceae bacterium]|nr:hypothetical protein [Cyclobacteriaceae bacterium]